MQKSCRSLIDNYKTRSKLKRRSNRKKRKSSKIRIKNKTLENKYYKFLKDKMKKRIRHYKSKRILTKYLLKNKFISKNRCRLSSLSKKLEKITKSKNKFNKNIKSTKSPLS